MLRLFLFLIFIIILFIVFKQLNAAGQQQNPRRIESSGLKVERPLLVELYTSQGCSSCPPADRVLQELVKDKNILPLSFHVDYWNYIGWKDPFSKEKWTKRQYKYNRNLQKRGAYTPQLIIEGEAELVGSQRNKVFSAIGKIAPNIISIPIEIAKKDNFKRIITIAENIEIYNSKIEYEILLITYDKIQHTYIKRGENKGVNLTNINVVQEVQNIGTYKGEKQVISSDLENIRGEKAIIIQQKNQGKVIGVKRITF